MSINSESKIAYVYSIFMIVLLSIVAIFLMCDFQVLSDSTCGRVNYVVNVLNDKVGGFIGIKNN